VPEYIVIFSSKEALKTAYNETMNYKFLPKKNE